MKSNKGFTNKAKSGIKAMTARWRQAAERAKTEARHPAPDRPGRRQPR